MILLDYHNVIIKNTLDSALLKEKREVLDMKIVDFDGVTYHISTPESKNVIQISLAWRCFSELKGADKIMEREYGKYLQPAEPGYDVTLSINVDEITDDEEKTELVKKVSLLKRNLLAAPFEIAFAEQKQFEDSEKPDPTPELMEVHYREEEAIYIKASSDRVVVIFTTKFKDETDKVFGKVFLQEFADARKRNGLQNAPQVRFSTRDPPGELRHLDLGNIKDINFVTFVLFPQHFEREDVRENTISLIQVFRDYLHYHIKCLKAYMHTRMRQGVQNYLKVLNRAKPEEAQAEKKTISGKTMRTR